MPGLPVLRRFQSSLVKSIFFEIGVFGGAAKLNQTVWKFMEAAAFELLPCTEDFILISSSSLMTDLGSSMSTGLVLMKSQIISRSRTELTQHTMCYKQA